MWLLSLTERGGDKNDIKSCVINYIELKCINRCCLFNFISNIPQVFGLNTDLALHSQTFSNHISWDMHEMQFFLLFQYY